MSDDDAERQPPAANGLRRKSRRKRRVRAPDEPLSELAVWEKRLEAEREELRAKREERARELSAHTPGVAEALSILIPGLGHVYARAPWWAGAWLLGSCGLLGGTAALALHLRPGLGVAALAAALVLPRGFSALHCRRFLTRRREERPVSLVLGLAAVLGLGFFAATASIVRSRLLDVRLVPPGMEPALVLDEWVFVDRTAYAATGPARGDVVLVESPSGDTLHIVRVVALPRERVELRGGQLVIDGVASPRCRMDGGEMTPDPDGRPRTMWLEKVGGHSFIALDNDVPAVANAATLGPREYFVLNDDRTWKGYDSREWHPGAVAGIHTADFLGKVMFVFSGFEHGRFGYSPNDDPPSVAARDGVSSGALDRCLGELAESAPEPRSGDPTR